MIIQHFVKTKNSALCCSVLKVFAVVGDKNS